MITTTPAAARPSLSDVFKDPATVKLAAAACAHDEEQARRAVQEGAQLNKGGVAGATPLHWAFGMCDPEAMSILVKLGADPNFTEPGDDAAGPLVWLAAQKGRIRELEVLLKAGGDPNTKLGGYTAFLAAIQAGHRDIAEILLAHGVSINGTALSNGKGATALGTAVMNRRFGLGIWLLENGYTNSPVTEYGLLVDIRDQGGFFLPSKRAELAQLLNMMEKRIAALRPTD